MEPKPHKLLDRVSEPKARKQTKSAASALTINCAESYLVPIH